MKTENHSISDVLSRNSTSFFIPPFQRSYAWGRSDIERYFSDVSRIIESELDSSQQDKLEHFFGTVVIKEERSGFANISIVVDGQQRLTTTLILLIALRDIEEDTESKNFITSTYLINSNSDFEDKIKLKQVTKDWGSYRGLIKGEHSTGIIKNAYDQFSKLISDRRKSNPSFTFGHYITAIKRMNVAVIFLDERPFKGEDPQIIFETLNSLGRPLTLSDLVRNFVLLNMNSTNQSNTYETTWHPKIEQVLNENTSKFFRDYLQYKMAKPLKVVNDTNTKELYQQFKEFVNTEFKDGTQFIEDIVSFVTSYCQIIDERHNTTISSETTKDKSIKELLRNIFHDVKSEAFKPFVLGLLKHHSDQNMTDDKLIESLESIKVYLTRRRVLSLTQGENKHIVTLSKKIVSITEGEVSVMDLLVKLSYKLRLPNDSEIRKYIATLNFYEGLKSYSKYILGKIEEHNTKVAVDFRDKKITIEHVMPQSLNNSWKEYLGDHYETIHKNYLHNIGNLILTEFNSEMGNKPFEEKKEKLATSSLNYRLNIINRDSWNEQSILEHQEIIIESFLNTFPIHDNLKDNSNYNTELSAQESTKISPLDSDAGERVEGAKPSKIYINGAVLDVKTWRDVFLRFVLLISKDFDFSLIMDNQAELFGNEKVFVMYSALKQMVETQPDLSKRYKNIVGKKIDEITDLSDNNLFIYINISAQACMSRIERIMDKFSISADFVQIELK